MNKKIVSIRRIVIFSLCSIIVFGLSIFSVYSQQMPNMNNDTANLKTSQMGDDEEVPHPFFTHMGMPEAPGVFSLRTSALLTKNIDGKSTGDFAFHLEMGLSKLVGLHIRNDRFLDNTHTEIMFQFAAIRSKDGMSGFSPLIEFEIPTKKGVTRINSLVGFSTALVRSRFAINQVIHYNPREDMVDGSIALVYKVTKGVFVVIESLGKKMMDENAIVTLIGGVKIKLYKNLILGVGYQHTLTTNKEFLSQYIFQPNFEWKR